MNEWVKIATMLGGVAITMYVTQREQSYRLAALEKSFDGHLQLHSLDLSEIRKDLSSMKVDLATVAAKECQSPARLKALEQNQWVR